MTPGEKGGGTCCETDGWQDCCWLPFIHPRRRSSCANVEGSRRVRRETRCQAKVAPKSLALACVGDWETGLLLTKEAGKQNHALEAILFFFFFLAFPETCEFLIARSWGRPLARRGKSDPPSTARNLIFAGVPEETESLCNKKPLQRKRKQLLLSLEIHTGVAALGDSQSALFCKNPRVRDVTVPSAAYTKWM